MFRCPVFLCTCICILIAAGSSLAKFIDSEPSELNVNAAPIISEVLLNRHARQSQSGDSCKFTKEVEKTVVTTPADWIDKVIAATNVHRKNHGVPPLVKSEKLCKIAQYWVNKLAAANSFDHSDFGCGENIWMGMGPRGSMTYKNINPNDPLNAWYGEVKDYDFTKHAEKNPSKPTGHFTQLVWKETKYHCVAIGISKDKSSAYVVAEYWPAGNFWGADAENVFPIKSGK